MRMDWRQATSGRWAGSAPSIDQVINPYDLLSFLRAQKVIDLDYMHRELGLVLPGMPLYSVPEQFIELGTAETYGASQQAYPTPDPLAEFCESSLYAAQAVRSIWSLQQRAAVALGPLSRTEGYSPILGEYRQPPVARVTTTSMTNAYE